MGRNKRHAAKRKNAEKKKPKLNVWNQDCNSALDNRVTLETKNNENFVHYYRTLNILPEDEWDAFYSKLKEPLPTTFRVVAGTFYTNYIIKIVQEAEAKLPNIIRRVPGYPGFVYEVNASRCELRSSESLREFHQFLVHQSEVGTLFRQELVSMIPVRFMPVEKHSRILDMCAAPGSKTAQLLELLWEKGGGLIIANDADSKRGHMAIHRLRRLDTSSLLVTNHEAQCFPNTFVRNSAGELRKLKFSTILCDVPCSGDGTLRKSAVMWKDWDNQRALSLHRVQLSILQRALQLCEVGGTVVYSTCSFNPIENEAIVNAALARNSNWIELIEDTEKLQELPHRRGMIDWSVFYKNTWYSTFDEIPSTISLRGCLSASMFPNIRSNRSDLTRCYRFYPHLYNTGGFFVAIFRKTREPRQEACVTESNALEIPNIDKPLDPNTNTSIMLKDVTGSSLHEDRSCTVSASTKSTENVLKPQTDFLSFDQHFQNDPSSTQRLAFWGDLGGMYGFRPPSSEAWKRLLIRTVSEESPRKVSIVTQDAVDVVHGLFRTPLKILSAGCQVFDGKHSKEFRISSLGARILANEKWAFGDDSIEQKSKHVAIVSPSLLLLLLQPLATHDDVEETDFKRSPDYKYRHRFETFEGFQGHEKLLQLDPNNPCLLIVRSTMCGDIYVPAWRGKTNIQLLIDTNTRFALIEILQLHQQQQSSQP